MKGEKLLSLLKSRHLTGDIYSEERIVRSLSFENNRFKSIDTTESSGTGLRVKDLAGREGFSFGNTESESILTQALELAAFGEKTDYDFPASSAYPSLEMDFQQVKTLNEKELMEQGKQTLEKILSRFPGLNVSLGFSWGEKKTTLLNTSGIAASYPKTYYGVSVSAMKAENHEILETYEYSASNNYHEALESLSGQLMTSMEYASRNATLASGNYPVIFTPKALRSFLDILLTGFNGKLMEKKVSPILDLLGKQAGSRLFSVMDSSLHPDLTSSAPFDGEGFPGNEKFLIHQGIFNDGIFDLKTASKMNRNSSGNGARSFASLPSPGFNNLIILPGDQSLRSIQSQISSGILVDQLLGAGMSNVMAGEFSANIDLGYVIDKGEITGRIKDTMISGNVFDMVKKISLISSERLARGGTLFPWILFEGIQVSR